MLSAALPAGMAREGYGATGLPAISEDGLATPVQAPERMTRGAVEAAVEALGIALSRSSEFPRAKNAAKAGRKFVREVSRRLGPPSIEDEEEVMGKLAITFYCAALRAIKEAVSPRPLEEEHRTEARWYSGETCAWRFRNFDADPLNPLLLSVVPVLTDRVCADALAAPPDSCVLTAIPAGWYPLRNLVTAVKRMGGNPRALLHAMKTAE